MTFTVPRSLVVERIQARITFIEEKLKVFNAKQEKLKELRESMELGRAPSPVHSLFPRDSGVQNQLKTLRFALEYMPKTETVELNLADAVMLGVIDPTSDHGIIGLMMPTEIDVAV